MVNSKQDAIQVKHDSIIFNGGLQVSFQRTLRIPDDGKSYPLPPGLGSFPVRRVDDYRDRVPKEWLGRGGVFIPMYQREAMWIRFSGEAHKPRAVKVAVGKVCALTGATWSESLHAHKQDYVVSPPQPWLDGIATGTGVIRQFVAMPLGMGYTVEGQVTGKETFGGIQLKVVEPHPGIFPDAPPPPLFDELDDECCLEEGCAAPPPAPCASSPAASGAPAQPGRARRSASMGLGAGGKMKQKIYPDPHGVDTWDEDNSARLFVHIVNSELWREITGEEPPRTPVTAKTYAQYNLPWFDVYDEGVSTVAPSPTLAAVKSIKVMDDKTFGAPMQDDETVYAKRVKKILLKMAEGIGVRDGDW